MKSELKKNQTSSELSKMDVHEFGIYINENYHLYSDNELNELTKSWRKEYENYLIQKIKPLINIKI